MSGTRTRRPSAADPGGPPLGLGLPGPVVDGETYWPLKRRWLAGDDELTEGQLRYIGALPKYRPDPGWREASAWTLSLLKRDEAYEAQLRGIRWLVDLADGHELLELSA